LPIGDCRLAIGRAEEGCHGRLCDVRRRNPRPRRKRLWEEPSDTTKIGHPFSFCGNGFCFFCHPGLDYYVSRYARIGICVGQAVLTTGRSRNEQREFASVIGVRDGVAGRDCYHVPVGCPSILLIFFPGPFAVRRLGRTCDAEGLFANRCLSEAIADVRASCDSQPRRRAAPSAAARPARRLFPSPFWPVKKGTSRRVIPAGSLQQSRRSHTGFVASHGRALPIPLRDTDRIHSHYSWVVYHVGRCRRPITIRKNCTTTETKNKKPAPAIAGAGRRW
jgi:hypothetical protein